MEEMHKKIEMKAYEYFMKRGMTHGNDIADWLKAEKEVMKEDSGMMMNMAMSSKKMSMKKK